MIRSEQEYMQGVFPSGAELPGNSVTPCLVERGSQTDVVFLIKTDEEAASELGSTDRIRKLEVDVGWAGDRENELQIRFHFEIGDHLYECTSTVTDEDRQAPLGLALLYAARIGVFTATNDFQFVSFLVLEWDGSSHPDIRRVLLEAAAKGGNEK